MYLQTDRNIPLNEPVNIIIYHSKQLSLKLDAKVVRKGTGGVGLQIDNLDASSFVQLRDIVTDNSFDSGKIMHETYRMLNRIH